MAIRSEKEIYQVLEEYLRIQEAPVTCSDLMDIPGIRKAALEEFGGDVRVATNGISDTLGFMWRRELLTRFPAPKDSRTLARFAYLWDKKKEAGKARVPMPPQARGKTGLVITEQDGGVLIEFEKFTVFVKQK